MKKVYMTKGFSRFAVSERLTDARLLQAAYDVISERWDANLGGGVYKQRVARDGSGKSGGYRAIVLFKVEGHVFFVHGFAKNVKANVLPKELKALKRLAETYLSYSDAELGSAKMSGELIEVFDSDKEG